MRDMDNWYERESRRQDAIDALADHCEVLFSWDDGDGPYALVEAPAFIVEDEEWFFTVMKSLGVAPRGVIWDMENIYGSLWRVNLER